MKNQINSRDYELISAYLDDQLGSKERALFEERLKSEPELRNELKGISTTRLLLRGLPRQRAPRNYYVTALAVRPRPAFKLAPIFGIVSAAASVLLALVIFGSTFLSPATEVAMAPAASLPIETATVQQEIARSIIASPIPPTESAPAVMMGAPIQATPTPFSPEATTTLPEIATPTTIYIYIYPLTTTPENPFAIAIAPTETPDISCEQYYLSVPLPSSADNYNCPTPTGTLSQYLESILSTDTPTVTPTITSTPTGTLTTTPSPTATPSPSYTPTPSETPTPTATQTPTETLAPPTQEALPQAQKVAPPGGVESSSEVAPSDQSVGAGSPTQSTQEQSQATSEGPNYSFLNYLLLTVEISLAVIAVLAGITAIILRIRAR